MFMLYSACISSNCTILKGVKKSAIVEIPFSNETLPSGSLNSGLYQISNIASFSHIYYRNDMISDQNVLDVISDIVYPNWNNTSFFTFSL